jgi:nucleoside-diphosphate-sugar epimerase
MDFELTKEQVMFRQAWREVVQRELVPLVEEADVVYHLAAKINVDHSLRNPRLFVENNIVGTFNMLELSRKYGFKLLIASSSEAYGTSKSETMDESHPLEPRSPYAATKAAGDMLAFGHYHGFGTKVIIVRSFNFTGPGQSWDAQGAFIPKVMSRLLRGRAPIIFGDGEQQREYVDVRDVARAYELLSHQDRFGEVFCVGTGEPRTINEITRMILEVSGKVGVEPERRPARPGEVVRFCSDTSKLRELGWSPTYSFERTLADTWDYVWENLSNG